jgi:hypothetical protein
MNGWRKTGGSSNALSTQEAITSKAKNEPIDQLKIY